MINWLFAYKQIIVKDLPIGLAEVRIEFCVVGRQSLSTVLSLSLLLFCFGVANLPCLLKSENLINQRIRKKKKNTVICLYGAMCFEYFDVHV